MAKLIYNSDEENNREANVIEFTIPQDLNIYEFKTVCIRMASAMGYTDKTIKRAFGSDEHQTSEDIEFKEFISSLFTNTTAPLTGSFHATH